MDEETFLAAIRDMPHDQRTKLVYADWLDENGHPERAEYLRLLHEQLVIADRLAQLSRDIEWEWLEKVQRPLDLVVHSFAPANTIPLIKLVREHTGLGLRAAKELVESPFPIRVIRELPYGRASELLRQFALLATVRVEPSLPE